MIYFFSTEDTVPKNSLGIYNNSRGYEKVEMTSFQCTSFRTDPSFKLFCQQ